MVLRKAWLRSQPLAMKVLLLYFLWLSVVNIYEVYLVFSGRLFSFYDVRWEFGWMPPIGVLHEILLATVSTCVAVGFLRNVKPASWIGLGYLFYESVRVAVPVIFRASRSSHSLADCALIIQQLFQFGIGSWFLMNGVAFYLLVRIIKRQGSALSAHE